MKDFTKSSICFLCLSYLYMFSLLELSDEAVQSVTRWIIRKFFLISSLWVPVLLSSNKQNSWEKGKEGNLHMLTTFSAPGIKLLILPQTIFRKPCEAGIILILPLRKVRLSDGTSCRTSLQHILSCHQCCSCGHLRSWFNSQKPWLRELWHLLSLRRCPIDDTVRRSSVLSKAFVQKSKSFPRFHKIPIL